MSPFLLVALNLYANHLYFLLSPRYGYALLPGIAAADRVGVPGTGARSCPGSSSPLLSVVNMLT